MPQLNPAPWLFILTVTWLALLLIVTPKVMAYVFPNEPASQSTEKSKKTTWNWPWP